MNDISLKFPEEQPDLVGHEVEQKLLLDLWNKKSLAGSWLFCGPKGIGKATLAYRLARFILSQPGEGQEEGLFGQINDVVPVSLEVSENNPVFKSVAKKTNPGLKVIECALKEEELKSRQALIDAGKPLDPEVEKNRKRFNEIRIDDIREAEAFLHLTAGANGWRVLIIDAADDMNVNASNALLKSLEEPPAKTVIILISHQPGKLLQTIRSRCRKLTLKPLENNILKEKIKLKCDDFSSDDPSLLLQLSQGSMGKALFLIENNGVDIFKQMLALFESFPDLRVSQIYDFVEKASKNKDVFKIAQMLFIQLLSLVCLSDATQTDEEFLLEYSGYQRLKKLPVLRLMDLINEFQSAFGDIDLDQKQVFINAFFELQREAG